MNDVLQSAWGRLHACLEEVPPGPLRASLDLMRLATRVRLGDGDATATLAGLDVERRLAALELVSANVPATEATARVARDTVFATESFAQLSDRVIAVWAGMTLAQARWGETNSFDRIRALGRLVASGTPPDVAGMQGLIDQFEHEVEVDAAVVAWFTERPFTGCAEELALLERTRRPGSRLEAIGAIVAQRDVAPELAASWLATADDAIAAAPAGAAGLHRARKAALLSLAGRPEDVASLMALAFAELEREADPQTAARTHRAALSAAAVAGFDVWEGAVERLALARVYLRDPEAFLSVRAHAVRTLPRAARTAADVDRGGQALTEMGRRLPDRWLALVHQAVVARLMRDVVGRSSDAQLERVATWLRADGLPRPTPIIPIEEVVAPLVAVDAERALALGDLLPSPVQRALWAVAVVTALAP